MSILRPSVLWTILAMTALSTAAQAQTSIGVSAVVQNDVSLQSQGSADPRAAIPSESVFMGDVVRSGDDAAIQIIFNDETIFSLGENAEIEIDEFVYDPAAQNGSITASIARGSFRFMSGQIAKANPDSVTLTSPNANIGVRGTMVDIVVGEEALAAAKAAGIGDMGEGATDGATLVVLRGPGREQIGLNRDGGAFVSSGGDEVTIWKSGTAVFVPRSGGEIMGPFRLRDGFVLSFAGQPGSGSSGVLLERPPRPPREIGRVTRELPDLRRHHRPPPPGGFGGNGCAGECPNNQEDGFPSQSPGDTFDPGDQF